MRFARWLSRFSGPDLKLRSRYLKITRRTCKRMFFVLPSFCRRFREIYITRGETFFVAFLSPQRRHRASSFESKGGKLEASARFLCYFGIILNLPQFRIGRASTEFCYAVTNTDENLCVICFATRIDGRPKKPMYGPRPFIRRHLYLCISVETRCPAKLCSAIRTIGQSEREGLFVAHLS